MSSQHSLTVAHVLADLMSLQTTDHAAATSLLTANKELTSSNEFRRKSSSNPAIPSRTSFSTPSRRTVEDPNRERPSLLSYTSSASEMNITQLEEVDEADDEDMKRAKELVGLYAMRGKFQRMGDKGLGRAKEKVDAVVAAYKQKETRLAAEEEENSMSPEDGFPAWGDE